MLVEHATQNYNIKMHMKQDTWNKQRMRKSLCSPLYLDRNWTVQRWVSNMGRQHCVVGACVSWWCGVMSSPHSTHNPAHVHGVIKCTLNSTWRTAAIQWKKIQHSYEITRWRGECFLCLYRFTFYFFRHSPPPPRWVTKYALDATWHK